MSFLSGLSTMAIVAVSVTVIFKVMENGTKPAKVKINENGEKTSDIHPFIYWFTYGASSFFALVGLGVLLFTDEPFAGLGGIAMGFIFFLPIAILHRGDTSVEWTDEYITGAKRAGSFKKHRILWSDVVSATFHKDKTIQIKDKFGKSVFSSVFEKGWYEIIEDLRRLRPDINTDDFG